MAIIRIKKTPRSSYNDQRRPSQLLLDQIAHLEWAVLPAAARRARSKPSPVKTEAQAAARVAQLLALLLEAKEAAATKPAVRTLPAMPKGVRRPKSVTKGPTKRQPKTPTGARATTARTPATRAKTSTPARAAKKAKRVRNTKNVKKAKKTRTGR